MYQPEKEKEKPIGQNASPAPLRAGMMKATKAPGAKGMRMEKAKSAVGAR